MKRVIEADCAVCGDAVQFDQPVSHGDEKECSEGHRIEVSECLDEYGHQFWQCRVYEDETDGIGMICHSEEWEVSENK